MNARNYLFEHEPGRHALVLGNSDYDNLAPLHSARLDAKRMSAELEQLGFAVTLVTRLPSVRAFEDDVLPPFRDTIKPGDMVLFYFSGHGFAYGPNNFLAPANLPLVVSGERVSECAIAVESVEDYLARQSPGVVLMFIDACRTIAGLVIKDSGTPSVVSASMRRVASPERIDIVEAFAARAGTAALGSSVGATLSPLTKALVAHIAAKDVELSAMLREVAADVLLATDHRQSAGVVSWSVSDVYLNPTPSGRAREKEAWLTALGSNTGEGVQRFAYRHGLSRHAAAARQWLSDDREPGIA